MPDNKRTIPICSCLVVYDEDGNRTEHSDPGCRVHGDGTSIISVRPIPPELPPDLDA